VRARITVGTSSRLSALFWSVAISRTIRTSGSASLPRLLTGRNVRAKLNAVMARLSLIFLLTCLSASATLAQNYDEHIVVTGGPSIWEWEKYKIEPHDNWWMNFVRASRIRIAQLREQYGPSAYITWLIYGPGYKRRQAQEKENLFSIIDSVRNTYNLKLIYFKTADELCDYLNRGEDRSLYKIASFDYFGHSNRACFMFDYSSQIGSASKCWLHETELREKLQRGIFAKNAQVQSWGCYTALSMSALWRAATGAKMIGATCKTQYMTNELPVLVSSNGKWSTGE
jgi:hypothetical protein